MQLLRKLAFPIALLYGLVVRIRNFCYDHNIFVSKSFKTPIVCIGNLTVGGTGKTPMVALLADLLGKKHRLAVLSRGYRRKTRGFLLADANSTAADIGDEPLQLFISHPGLAVAVDSDRQRGIARLEALVGPELILLDDAFQHRRVIPHLSILLTAYGELYMDDFFLPAGNLRDSRLQARRADLIVVTKCPDKLSDQERQGIHEALQPLPHQQLLFARLRYDPVLRAGTSSLELSSLEGTEFVLLTGIASPGPLVSYLQGQGLSFEHKRYPDHHMFTEDEIGLLRGNRLVITTEKDYRRIGEAPANFYYIAVAHELLGNGKNIIKDKLEALL